MGMLEEDVRTARVLLDEAARRMASQWPHLYEDLLKLATAFLEPHGLTSSFDAVSRTYDICMHRDYRDPPAPICRPSLAPLTGENQYTEERDGKYRPPSN